MDSNLSSRFLAAIVAMPALIWLVGWGPPWLFTVFIFVLTIVALHEFFTLAFPASWKDRLIGVGYGLCLAAILLLEGQVPVIEGVGMLLLTGFSIHLFVA
ncbi:MAG TPA: hypothetical protein VJQ55_16265, partial [Candidatus Binatia bacterium]|nr:hypothetical protein [Candidatus Binatia bacterium]